jgi:putative ABC transport system ATP-binding protein
MIELEGITKRYEAPSGGSTPLEVLRGVSCRIEKGEFVAIMGQSGSGKSTLLNILGYLERPDSGAYRLDGTDHSTADDDTLSAIRNRKIGFVFQQFPLLDRVSAMRNVMLPLLYDEDVIDGEARASRALAAVGLSERAHHRPSQLSGGEQQRVAIARALVNDPDVILADEPTGSLDERAGAQVLDILAGLRADGRTVVLVTHDSAVAARAQRTLRLENARLIVASAGGLEPAARIPFNVTE